jgi:outer membrane protein assembly factor BamB
MAATAGCSALDSGSDGENGGDGTGSTGDADDGTSSTVPDDNETPSQWEQVECDPATYPDPATGAPDGAWPSYRGGPRGTTAKPDVSGPSLDEATYMSGVEFVHESRLSRVIVVDGTVYVSDDEHTYAFDAATSNWEWRLPEGDGRVGPTVTDDTVYVPATTSHGHVLIAVDRRDGEPRWVAEQEESVDIDPVVADGCVVVATEPDGLVRYTAYDLACGSERWSRELGGEWVKGAASDGTTVYAASDHSLAAIDAANGSERWRVPLDTEYSFRGQPAVVAGVVVLLLDQEDLLALSAADGSQLWQTEEEAVDWGLPAVSRDTVYFVSGRRELTALALESGDRRWSHEYDRGQFETKPTLAGNSLYLPVDDGPDSGMLEIYAGTGAKLGFAEFRGFSGSFPPEMTELVVSADGLFGIHHIPEGGPDMFLHRFVPET